MHRTNLNHRWDTEIFIIQEESRQGLVRAGERILRFLYANLEVDLKDLAYSLNCPLRESGCRLAIVADSSDDLKKKLAYALQRLAEPKRTKIKDRSGIYFFEEPLSREGSLAFLFPGQGSQYFNMLSDLCLHFPEVRVSFDLLDRIFLEEKWDILPSQLLLPQTDQSLANNRYDEGFWGINFSVATVFAADYALLTLLNRLGIRPQAVVGHSSGEFAALLAAGVIGIRDEDELVLYGRELISLYKSLDDSNSDAKLMTVGISDPGVVGSVVAESDGDLYVAMDNCPHQVILCGSEEAITHAQDQLSGKGAICTLLPYDRPYHTPLFQAVRDQYSHFFHHQKSVPPHTTFFSCATTHPYPRDPSELMQLAVEQWAQPVRFRETIEVMYDSGVRIFVEVGPRDILISFVDDILRERQYLAVPTNVSNRPAITQINHMLGLLAANGVEMRLDYLYERRAPQRVLFEKAPNRGEQTRKPSVSINLNTELPKLKLKSGTPIRIACRSGPSPRTHSKSGRPDASPKRQKGPAGKAQQHKPFTVHGEQPSTEGQGDVQNLSPSQVLSHGSADFKVPKLGSHHPQSSRSQGMQEYLNTMERFLDMQRELMVATIHKDGIARGEAPAGMRGGGRYPLPKHSSYDQELQALEGPFNITVVSMSPGEEMVATCQLDMDEHVFMQHHTLGGRPSAFDTTLTALPVVPLTFSVEIMAQAASRLLQKKHFLGMKNVRAHRWITVEEQRCTLSIVAKRKGAYDVQVKILRSDENQGREPRSDKEVLLIEGLAVFGNEYPVPRKIDAFPLISERPYRFSREKYYQELMFHGPSFQGVVSIDRIGDDGAEGTVRIPEQAEQFRSHRNTKLLTNPLLLDLAAQVVGFWAQDYLESWSIAFLTPIGFDDLEVYGHWPPEDELIKCYVRSTPFPPTHIHSNIDMVESGGYLIARLTGAKYAHFLDWTRQAARFALHPCDAMLSSSWLATIAHLPLSFGFQCCRLHEDGGDIWPQIIAHVILSRRERKTWSSLTGTEKRRLEWLLGRLAAKDVVRLLLRDRYQLEAYPADIEIASDESGRPIVRGPIIEKIGCSLSLSIAHAGGGAVAIVGECPEDQAVGIDVEPIDQDHQGLEDVALTSAERELLLDIPGSERREWLLRFWCAKEAVGKALGRGMVGSPRNLVVKGLELETGGVSVMLAGGLARQLPDRAHKLFTAYTGCENGLIFATSLV